MDDFDTAPPPDSGNVVTVSAFSWWRGLVLRLVREVHDIRRDVQEIKQDVKDLPAQMAEQRDARIWRGLRGWLVAALGALIVGVILAVLGVWITNAVNQLHMVPAK